MPYVKAEEANTPEARKNLCESLQGKVRQAKRHFEKDFKHMIEDMKLAHSGSTSDWDNDCYVVNVTQRFVRQKVAALYAKNPRATAKRKPRLEYQYWDGSSQSLMAAQEQMMMAQQQGMEPPPEAMALLQDVQEANARNRMLDRVGKTMECMYRYYTNEQVPDFKTQMKACVRSSVQTAVGYLKLGFQREMDLSPENKAKIADYAQRIAHIERLQNDITDDSNGVDPESSKEAEELRLAMQQLQSEESQIIREGLIFDFPSPTSIIPDPRCTSLAGWIGADWIAEEIFLTTDEVKEFYGVDLGHKGNQVTMYRQNSSAYMQNPRTDIDDKNEKMICCWVMWHKPSGLKFSMADGHSDFLEEPIAPEVTVERFFPVYALCFNQLLHPERLFPPSDVRLMLHPQMEMNRTREAVREHRIASRPGYAIPRGSMSDEDKEALGNHPPNAAIEIDGLIPGQKVSDLLQPLPKMGIDPNLYELQSVMQDVYLAVGANESTFGSTSNSTATEAAIAESNRSGALEAEIDELNDFLTQIARDAGQVMLMELDVETVREIVGPGAIWPEMSKAQIAKELYLDVVAGSNGRPNRAQRQQALQQLVPFLIQVPGVQPEWLAKLLIEAVDDSIDLSEAIAQNVPSIMTINNQTQATGATEDPNSQGAQGGNNAQRPAQPSQGPGGQGGRDRKPVRAA